jgi:hypothetical protein
MHRGHEMQLDRSGSTGTGDRVAVRGYPFSRPSQSALQAGSQASNRPRRRLGRILLVYEWPGDRTPVWRPGGELLQNNESDRWNPSSCRLDRKRWWRSAAL